MARLQDFPTVTPTSSDNILIVKSDGQGLASVGGTLGAKMDKANPTGTGSLSIGRKSGTTTGSQSIAVGYNVEASAARAVAFGHATIAEGDNGSFAEGYQSKASGTYGAHSEGRNTEAKGTSSHAEGINTKAEGAYSHAEGLGTLSNHRSQHTFGEYNDPDTSTAASNVRGTYVEIVGKGTSDANRSNARTLDWSGNEVLAGGLKLHGNQDAATLNLTGSIAASGGTLDCSSYSDGAIIFLYRPTANKVGIYVKTNTWPRVIPIVPISTVSVSGYVITNNDTEGLRGSVIST